MLFRQQVAVLARGRQCLIALFSMLVLVVSCRLLLAVLWLPSCQFLQVKVSNPRIVAVRLVPFRCFAAVVNHPPDNSTYLRWVFKTTAHRLAIAALTRRKLWLTSSDVAHLAIERQSRQG